MTSRIRLLTLILAGTQAMDAADQPSPLTINTGRDDSVLIEHRRAGTGADDFAKRYPAARSPKPEVLNPKSDARTGRTSDFGFRVSMPVEVVKRFAVGGSPLLWFNRDKTEVVCDPDVFPNGLTVADATRLDEGETAEIGRIDRTALESLGILNLSEFLIRAGAVQTWIHLESTLTLTETTPGSASFRGSHVYFTNRENVDPLAFTIRVDDTGVITVTGDKK